MKKVATHVHTAPLSGCAQVPAEEIPALYKAKGYSAIVVTNHYMKYVFEQYYGISGERQQLEHFLSGYRAAKRAAEGLGISVWLGAECNPDRYNRPGHTYPVREFLLYGTDEAFFLNHPRLYDLSQEELFALCEACGVLMLQSHPFRLPTEPGNPEAMHGIEALNRNPRHESRNELAGAWAKERGFLIVAGDDFHEYGDEGRAATLMPDDCESYADFVAALRAGRTKAVSLV